MHRAAGRRAEAESIFAQAEAELTALRTQGNDSSQLRAALLECYASLGRREEVESTPDRRRHPGGAPEEFRRAAEEASGRRKLLHCLVTNDGWEWHDVVRKSGSELRDEPAASA
ncbi:MAG: hypothetical protein H0T11_05425 [Chthoniobacterales bacterium]|nr:hypothetical protein [Chthoniobacterales bacterium]